MKLDCGNILPLKDTDEKVNFFLLSEHTLHLENNAQKYLNLEV